MTLGGFSLPEREVEHEKAGTPVGTKVQNRNGLPPAPPKT